MELRILGPVAAVTEDGQPLALGGAQQRAVVALLALEAGRAVPRTALVDGIWGDDPSDTAANTLQVYVSQLRRLLGREVVRTIGAGYALNAAAVAVDRDRFGDLVAEGSRQLQRGRRRPRARRCGGHWRCGGGRRWPMSPTFRSHSRRWLGWRNCGSRRPSSESRPTWPVAASGAGGRAAGTRRRSSVPGAVAGRTDGCAVPGRPAGRGARGLYRGPAAAGRRAGDRARPGAAAAAPGDPGRGPHARRASVRSHVDDPSAGARQPAAGP